jgi:aryl sulfotransferase
MSNQLPVVTRTYQNHHLDSTRWSAYTPRSSDIIVSTSYKAGTTWTQHILHELLHGNSEPMPGFRDVTPWPDARFMPISKQELGAFLDNIPGRRFIKSHLPLDGLPFYPEVKYVIVGRDCRDVFMSFYNHYASYTELAMSRMNAPDIVGDKLPPCPKDPREVWTKWISQGWFEWESEGYPFWSNLAHTQSYWEYRHLPNIYFMHYNDMLADLEGSIRKLADFLGESPSPQHLAKIVENTTFANVKSKAIEEDAKGDQKAVIFDGGSAGFYFKGTNGRWRDVLTAQDLALYEAAKARVLTPESAKWLEQGGVVPK